MTNNDIPPRQVSRKVSPGVELAQKVEVNRETNECRLLPREESRLSDVAFRQLLMSGVLSGSSDLTIQSDRHVRVEIHGRLYWATRRALAPSEVEMILGEIYGPNGVTMLKGRKVLDFSYEVNLEDGTKQRFRVNATGILAREERGIEITMRTLPTVTPDKHYVQLSDDELEALSPRDGVVVIAGATGSGKSTTMAAIIRAHLENVGRPVKIVDIQSPIEYTYRDVLATIGSSPSLIGQSEVGMHIESFFHGSHSALRRKPGIISVGEARDFETISATLEAALTGHLVYTTTHAASVSNAVRRLLVTFPGNERESRAYDLISALQFVLVQFLVPRADKPGVVPVREYLRITDRIREALFSMPMNDWPAYIGREVNGEIEGVTPQDMRKSKLDSVSHFYRNGIISYEDARLIAPVKR